MISATIGYIAQIREKQYVNTRGFFDRSRTYIGIISLETCKTDHNWKTCHIVLLENGYWWRFPKVSFCIFLCNFLGWISLCNFNRLLKKELKIASWYKINPRVFEKQSFDISSVQFFNLVVLNRFLMSNSYFMLNSKSLRILICHHFGLKSHHFDDFLSFFAVFHQKLWQIKILRLLEFNMKYEFDIRNQFRITKLKNRTDEMSKIAFQRL